jgi:hypothetical protein
MQVGSPVERNPRSERADGSEDGAPDGQPALPAQCGSGRASGQCAFWPMRGCSPACHPTRPRYPLRKIVRARRRLVIVRKDQVAEVVHPVDIRESSAGQVLALAKATGS